MSSATTEPTERPSGELPGQSRRDRNPWSWVPSLYFAEGIPLVIVLTVALAMYKKLGVSNTTIGLYTSYLYLPWVIKPFWSPLVDLVRTKRWWIVSMQLLIGAGLAGVGLAIPGDNFLTYTMVFLWLLAFSSATHDIAADGFYMLDLTEHEQAWFVGIRSTFYRLATITGQGLLVILAGWLEESFGIATAWSYTFYIASGMFLILTAYHVFFLPRPTADVPRVSANAAEVFSKSLETFAAFFRKKHMLPILAFLMLYRFAEAQLVKMASLFLLDKRSLGGLGLSTKDYGIVYGTVGVAMLLLGGILGGLAAARKGLHYWLWGMALAINLPNAVYVFLAYVQPENLMVVNLAVMLEQFGYGFGFTAYMLFTLYVSKGEHETAHYAICTGFMALGMMLPGMASGWLQTKLGYQHFFLWVMLSTIPSFLVCAFVSIDPAFGRRKTGEEEP